jgi:hypothetical protein
MVKGMALLESTSGATPEVVSYLDRTANLDK